MNTNHSPGVRMALAVVVLASFVMDARAQAPAKPQTVSSASVTDPSAPVPVTVYQSVFQNTPKGVETESDNWRKANDEVGKFLRGHVDILKWEEAQAAKSRVEAKVANPVADSAAKPALTPSAAKPTTTPVEATNSPMPAGHKH